MNFWPESFCVTAQGSVPVKSGSPLLLCHPGANLQNDGTRQQKFNQWLLLRQAFRAATAIPMEHSTIWATTVTSGVLLRTQQQTPGTGT